MFDNQAYFYDTGPFGLATLCALGATTFAGHLDTVGENAFDAAATTTHTLRYQDSTEPCHLAGDTGPTAQPHTIRILRLARCTVRNLPGRSIPHGHGAEDSR